MSNIKPIEHSDTWYDTFYLWVIARFEKLYNIQPIPRPILNPEQTFWRLVAEQKELEQTKKQLIEGIRT